MINKYLHGKNEVFKNFSRFEYIRNDVWIFDYFLIPLLRFIQIFKAFKYDGCNFSRCDTSNVFVQILLLRSISISKCRDTSEVIWRQFYGPKKHIRGSMIFLKRSIKPDENSSYIIWILINYSRCKKQLAFLRSYQSTAGCSFRDHKLTDL